MKKIIGILVVIVIVAGAIILWTRKAETPEEPATDESAISEEATEENTTPEAIGQDLESIDLGDLESEAESIDLQAEGLE